eukprot:gene9078-6371_t
MKNDQHGIYSSSSKIVNIFLGSPEFRTLCTSSTKWSIIYLFMQSVNVKYFFGGHMSCCYFYSVKSTFRSIMHMPAASQKKGTASASDRGLLLTCLSLYTLQCKNETNLKYEPQIREKILMPHISSAEQKQRKRTIFCLNCGRQIVTLLFRSMSSLRILFHMNLYNFLLNNMLHTSVSGNYLQHRILTESFSLIKVLQALLERFYFNFKVRDHCFP